MVDLASLRPDRRPMIRWFALFMVLCLPAFGQEDVADRPVEFCSQGDDSPKRCIRQDSFAADLCALIEAEADLHGLPPSFLARLLWQESRFDPNAVSPKQAKGIAQFIDSTARLRGLENPFNPAAAVAKSAAYLGEMNRRYGNVGLAAIGYNGGERRAEGWAARTGGLARETRDYVRIITGLSAETWRDDPPGDLTFDLDEEAPFQDACVQMAAARRVSPLVAEGPLLSPWGAQIAFGRDERAARAAYGRLRSACQNAAPASRLEFVRVQQRGPGSQTYTMVRVGAGNRDEAASVCRAVSRAGCPCRAFRN